MNDFEVDITVLKEVIMSRMYFIRRCKVILDCDLAKLYGIEIKALKKAVKRNINRFPSDFMFELTKEENDVLRSHFVDLKGKQYSKDFPIAFTEQGVAMLSSVLNGEKAIMVNIQIVRIFTRMHGILSDNLSLKTEMEEIKKRHIDRKKTLNWLSTVSVN